MRFISTFNDLAFSLNIPIKQKYKNIVFQNARLTTFFIIKLK